MFHICDSNRNVIQERPTYGAFFAAHSLHITSLKVTFTTEQNKSQHPICIDLT